MWHSTGTRVRIRAVLKVELGSLGFNWPCAGWIMQGTGSSVLDISLQSG